MAILNLNEVKDQVTVKEEIIQVTMLKKGDIMAFLNLDEVDEKRSFLK